MQSCVGDMGDTWCSLWGLACAVLLHHKEPWEKLEWWWLWRGDFKEKNRRLAGQMCLHVCEVTEFFFCVVS